MEHATRIAGKSLSRTAVLAALTLVTHCAVVSRGDQQVTSEAGTAPLALKIEMVGPRVCWKSCLIIRAQLTNSTSGNLAIDKRGLGHKIMLESLVLQPKGAAARHRTIQSNYGQGDYDVGSFLILKPGEFYFTTLRIPVADDFFKSEAPYKITITYGQFRELTYKEAPLFRGTVDSGELEFRVVHCNRSQLKESQRNCTQ